MTRRLIVLICVLFLTSGFVRGQGIISTVAGGNESSPGDGGPAIKAILNQPWGVVADRQGNIYFTDYANIRLYFSDYLNRRIRKIDTAPAATSMSQGYRDRLQCLVIGQRVREPQ